MGKNNAIWERIISHGFETTNVVSDFKYLYPDFALAKSNPCDNYKSPIRVTPFCKAVSDAKKEGINRLVLYGNSYINFLLIYACQTLNVTFIEKSVNNSIEPNSYCVIGEQNDEADIARLKKQGCVNLLDLIEE